MIQPSALFPLVRLGSGLNLLGKRQLRLDFLLTVFISGGPLVMKVLLAKVAGIMVTHTTATVTSSTVYAVGVLISISYVMESPGIGSRLEIPMRFVRNYAS